MADSFSTTPPTLDAVSALSGNVPSRTLLDSPAIHQALLRISRAILARNPDTAKLALVGLPTRGVTLAQRIAAELKTATGLDLPVGQIDITFHRDDLELRRPIPHVTDIPFNITDRVIVLVDDVLYSGRSVRAALNALNDLGRPEAIQLATLIDRGHRRLPIAADYIGQVIQTNFDDDIAVKMQEVDGLDSVEIRHA